MLADFYREVLTMSMEDQLKEFIDTFDVDQSGWVFVDGEEGDYGEVLYRHNGVLVAKMISEGGDSDRYEFTDEGKSLLLAKMVNALGAPAQESTVLESLRQDHETLRQTLEVIAVGDSLDPVLAAREALVETGFWEAPGAPVVSESSQPG